MREQSTEQRPFSAVIEKLKSAGLRPTRQRLALARLLFDGGDRHLTAEMLHGEAARANVRVSLATVYNTLHQFQKAGLLREIVVDSQRTYFDTNMSSHHHFYREDTGHLTDIPGEAITVSSLPPAPEGTAVGQVDIVVRLKPAE